MQDREKPPDHLHDELEELRHRPLESEIPGVTASVTSRTSADSDQILENILSVLPVGIVHERDGRIMWANGAWEKMFGFVSQHEYTGKHISIMYESRRAWEKERETSCNGLSQGENSQTDARFVRRDGSVFDACVSTRLVDSQGPFKGTITVISDLSKTNAIVEELGVERRRFESLARNSPFGMVMVQPDGSFSYANPKFQEMSGYSLDDVPNGKEWLKKAYPDRLYRREVISTWFEDIKGTTVGETRPRVFSVTCKDGSKKVIQFRPVRLDSGEDLMTLEDITERKLAEDAMRLNEARLEKIVDILHYKASSVQDFLDHALEGALELTHSKVGYIYFYEEDYEEFVLNTWSKEVMKECTIVNPQTHYQLEKTGIWGEAVRQRQPILVNDFQAPNPLKKGYPEGHASLHRYLTVPVYIGGRIVAVVGVANNESDYSQTDILQLTLLMDSVWKGVDRLSMVKALGESEATLKTVLQTAPIGIGLVADGTFIWANESLSAITGYDTEDLLGQSPGILYQGDKEFDRTGIFKPCGVGATRHEALETRWKRSDGSLVDILLSFSEVSPGDSSKGIVFSATDITERKLFQQDLEESEERMRLLLEAAPMGVRIATQGKYSYVNPAFLRMFGYESIEEIEGLPVEELYVENDRPMIRARNSRRARGLDVNHHYRVTGIRKDGSRFDLETWGSEISYKGRRSTFRFLIDVSESNSLRAQLYQSQKMEAIGTLAGGIAHDFNNILQIIVGYSELMLGREKEGDRDHGDLLKIFEAGQRGTHLVKHLMAFSRREDPKLIPVRLNDEVRKIEGLLSHTIPKKIVINLRLNEDLQVIQADPSQIGQILMNLAVNARDAMPNGGQFTIKTENVYLDEEYCAIHLNVLPGSYALLSVTDTGTGMDKETVNHIFEPFFTTKEVGKGTGLGLATVFGIVKQHRGHIRCYSEPGHGTTFNIYFPSFCDKEHPETVRSHSEVQGGTETILLVDDDEIIRDLGSRILREVGYNVILAENGKDALEIYARHVDKIALILLDLVMPEMDGQQCLEEIVKVDPMAKVLITSGYPQNGIFITLQAAGAKGFVEKPFDQKKLLTLIRDIIDKNESSEAQ